MKLVRNSTESKQQALEDKLCEQQLGHDLVTTRVEQSQVDTRNIFSRINARFRGVTPQKKKREGLTCVRVRNRRDCDTLRQLKLFA